MKRFVREVCASLGRLRTRMPKQLSHDFETEATRNQMGRIRVPIVVLSVVRNASLPDYGAPEFLDFAQGQTRLIAGK
jgi:hypothetical protein